MSVSGVMKAEEASAGSTLSARSPSGTRVPAVAATNMFMIMASAQDQPEPRVALHRPGRQRGHHAETEAVARPTRISFSSARRELAG